MGVHIETVYDRERLCGERKSGGMYLVAGKFIRECGKFPLRLDCCPACGSGVKVTRGLQRIHAQVLFANQECSNPREACRLCLVNRVGYGYLIGIGAKFYKTPDAFFQEAVEQGISKRINQIPHQFKVGETAVFLAHPHVFLELEDVEAQDSDIEEDAEQPSLGLDAHSKTTGRRRAVQKPGVIGCFIPQRIEYITRGDETEDQLEALVSRGITPVKVIRVQERQLSL